MIVKKYDLGGVNFISVDGEIYVKYEDVFDEEEAEEEVAAPGRVRVTAPKGWGGEKKPRKPVTCGNCGQEGHTTRTCSSPKE